MNRLFTHKVAASLNAQTDPTSRTTKPSSAKLDALEQELRDDTIDTKTSMVAQGQGQGTGTAQQKQMLAMYDPQNTDYNYYGSIVGDYTNLISQMADDRQGATTAMKLSTVEAKPEADRMQNSEDQWNLLAIQFGLQSRSEKVVKKAMKISKLGAGDSFL